MFRLCLPFLVLPSLGHAADPWDPQPSLFGYDSAFDLCLAEPNGPHLVATCDAHLTAAYVLKRAVVRATQACLSQDLAQCALPFEQEGLPAIAAMIAAGVGCDNADLSNWPETEPLADTHCAPLISDILFDEGVVPLDISISCGDESALCSSLDRLQSGLWANALLALHDQDAPNPLVRDLSDRVREDCRATANGDDPDAFTFARRFHPCVSDGLAAIWHDLSDASID